MGLFGPVWTVYFVWETCQSDGTGKRVKRARVAIDALELL